ncbi:glycosyltransferase family 2 protein [Sphingobacterium spiritivorum]|uniref:glycosyltransferase family 2 protein n=1 Tax=Sphingobacterium spiritivorum TaxID=258 RepID=UPI003DA328C7
MVNNPHLSVIIPVYNASLYIEKCGISLFEQTLQDIEYIFIDDCSHDNSIEILERLLDNYPSRKNNVKIIRNTQNKGVATTRNIGVSNANGKYIAHCDADDYIDKEMYEELLNNAESNQAEIVWCDFYNIYSEYQDAEYINQYAKPNSESIIQSLLIGEMMGSLWNKLILKELFIKYQISFPDGLNMCEDLRVCIQLFYYAKKVSYINKAYYHYVKYKKDSISVMSSSLPKVNDEWIENIKGIQNFIENKGSEDMKKSVVILKLVSKQNLLIKGNSIETFKQWKKIFPEANQYIQQTHLPLYYKIVARCILINLWIIPKLWISMKKFAGK